jgi:hypothetical protein
VKSWEIDSHDHGYDKVWDECIYGLAIHTPRLQSQSLDLLGISAD